MDRTHNDIPDHKLDKALSVYTDMKGVDLESSYSEFLSRVRRNRIRRLRKSLMSVAAVLILAVAGAGWLYFSDHGDDPVTIARSEGEIILTLPDGTEIVLGAELPGEFIADYDDVIIRNTADGGVEYIRKGDPAAAVETAYSTLTVPRGNQYEIILEDGTHVWLNSGTSLRFPVSFTEGERRIWLQGEAYFEVSRDVRKPFIVETADQTLQVLGTEFNIYAYPSENSIRTTLVEGSVRVVNNNGSSEVLLRPGQQAELLAGADSYTVAEVDARGISAWRNGLFIFNDNTLGTVFHKLSRWYDFEYVFEDTRIADIVIMGNLPVDLDFEAVLALINDSDIALIGIRDNLVTISTRK